MFSNVLYTVYLKLQPIEIVSLSLASIIQTWWTIESRKPWVAKCFFYWRAHWKLASKSLSKPVFTDFMILTIVEVIRKLRNPIEKYSVWQMASMLIAILYELINVMKNKLIEKVLSFAVTHFKVIQQWNVRVHDFKIYFSLCYSDSDKSPRVKLCQREIWIYSELDVLWSD